MFWKHAIISILFIASVLAFPSKVLGQSKNKNEFVVYSVYRGLDMGEAGKDPKKDFYVNMGTQHGLNKGMLLDVMRRIPTYDLASKKLHGDMTFKIGKLKVIHVEGTSAIARLEKMASRDRTPSVSPFAVMVGDIVKISR